MREESVTVTGWVNPATGQKTRRGDHAIKLWRYINPKFAGMEAFFFAAPGINTKEQALRVGYQLMTTQLALRVEE